MTVFATDPQLLLSFRKGNRDALARVYGHYVGVVASMLRRYLVAAVRYQPCAITVRADLADLIQEVFIKAFAEPARLAYDGVREYRPFLLTLSRNVVVDYLRSRGREVQMDVAAIEQLGDRDPPDESDAAPCADANTMLIVERYLGGLSRREHAVYVQRYVNCRSQTEAAVTLGLSRQQLRTMEAHLRRGLARELARASLSASRPKGDVSLSRRREPDVMPVGVHPERNR